jgi:hypothetical protein
MGKISQATITIEVRSGGPLELSDMCITVDPPLDASGEWTAAQDVAATLIHYAIQRAEWTVQQHAQFGTAQ